MSSCYLKMATVEQEKRILVGDDKVTVNNFQIQDPDIVSFFNNLNESDIPEQKLEYALKVGIVAIKSIGVAGNINYVEKAFNNLDEKMSQKLESAFGEDGKFSGVLKNHFGEDGMIIKELFDPNRDGSPLHSLRSDLEKHLSEIRDKLGIRATEEEFIEKSTQKGFDFEDECEKKLGWIADIHSDKLERTGNEAGRISKSKKGDFVLTLGDVDKKIVFEMKNRDSLGLPEIQKELKEAMENRGAEYGIYVVKKKSALPQCVGWFNEYNNNQLVCAVENDDGDSLIDGEIIHIAYKWARAKLRIESVKEKTLDPTFIVGKAEEVKKKIGDMKKIKTQCTSIEKSSKAIRDTAQDTETEIKKELDEIIESLEPKDN